MDNGRAMTHASTSANDSTTSAASGGRPASRVFSPHLQYGPAAGPKPIKVLHLVGRVGRGGAEVRSVRVLRQVDRRRFAFHFCAVSGRPGEFDDEVRSLGGQVHLISRGRKDFARRFAELLQREQYDVVHSNLQLVSGYLLRLAAQNGVPMRIAQFVNSQDDRIRGLARKVYRRAASLWDDRYASRRVLRRWIDRHATHILGLSEWSLTGGWRANWRDDPRCHVVYDGLDPAEFDAPAERDAVLQEFGLDNEGPLCIHVGRMARQKNHVRLADVFAALLRRRPTAQLLLVGRTVVGRDAHTMYDRLRRRIARLGIADRVVFAGERADVPRLLNAADVFLFPSLHEGLGDVVLESSAAGTPVLASDLPCIREIATRLPGVHYLSLNEPNARWARHADLLLAQPRTPRQRCSALKTFSRSVFTIDRCTDSLCRIWQGEATTAKRRFDAEHG